MCIRFLFFGVFLCVISLSPKNIFFLGTQKNNLQKKKKKKFVFSCIITLFYFQKMEKKKIKPSRKKIASDFQK
jgi:hypothetical protein